MIKNEQLPAPTNALAVDLNLRQLEDAKFYIRGDVFISLKDENGEETERRELRNLVVKDASIMLARLVKNPLEPDHGIFALAVGTGDVGWNLQSPPPATVTQRALYSEIARKTFSNTDFINSSGVPVSIPTNVVDFTTTFAHSEAVGPLCEMGLLGGDISSTMSVQNPVSPANGPYSATTDLSGKDTLVNYLTFPVVNKPATSSLSITWRLTF